MRLFCFPYLFSFCFVISICASELHPSFIKIGGSSIVYMLNEAVVEDYQKIDPRVKISIAINGTGGGMHGLCTGQFDIVGASREIGEEERAFCQSNGIQYLEVPIALDGIVFVVNAHNHFLSQISIDDLKKIWSRNSQHLSYWSDISPLWPKEFFSLYAPAIGSGTLDKTIQVLFDKEHDDIRSDYVASQDINLLAKGVAQDLNGFGIMSFSYYDQNKELLKALGVCEKNRVGKMACYYPTYENIYLGKYSSFSRLLYLYVNLNALHKKEGIKSFLCFYLSRESTYIKDLGFIPLNKSRSLLASLSCNSSSKDDSCTRT